MMMIDAFAVEGITEVAVDSIFMMPHLGVLSTIHPAAATEVFEKDCLVYLGTCIAPVGGKHGVLLDLEWRLAGTGADYKKETLSVGELRRIDLRDGAHAEAILKPARGVDLGQVCSRRRDDRVESPDRLRRDVLAALARLPVAAHDDNLPARELEHRRVDPGEAELEHAAWLPEQLEDAGRRLRGESGRKPLHE